MTRSYLRYPKEVKKNEIFNFPINASYYFNISFNYSL